MDKCPECGNAAQRHGSESSEYGNCYFVCSYCKIAYAYGTATTDSANTRFTVLREEDPYLTIYEDFINELSTKGE